MPPPPVHARERRCGGFPIPASRRSRRARGGALPRPGLRCRRPWRVPVLIRKLQCFSDTCAPPRVRPRQPAASISSHAFMSGGLRKVEPPVRARTGCDASRAARISAMRAAIAAGSPRLRPQPGADHHGAMRQSRMAVGERQIGGGQAALLAAARDDLGPVEARGDVAAIGAGVHRHRAADAARDAGEELQPGQPGAAACSATVTSSAAAPATMPSGFDRDRAEAARQADHHAGQAAVADDQVGTRRRSRAPGFPAAARAGIARGRPHPPAAPATSAGPPTRNQVNGASGAFACTRPRSGGSVSTKRGASGAAIMATPPPRPSPGARETGRSPAFRAPSPAPRTGLGWAPTHHHAALPATRRCCSAASSRRQRRRPLR